MYVYMYTQFIPVTVVGNMHKNLVLFDRVVFELCERTVGQTDKEKINTDHNTILCSPL